MATWRTAISFALLAGVVSSPALADDASDNKTLTTYKAQHAAEVGRPSILTVADRDKLLRRALNLPENKGAGAASAAFFGQPIRLTPRVPFVTKNTFLHFAKGDVFAYAGDDDPDGIFHGESVEIRFRGWANKGIGYDCAVTATKVNIRFSTIKTYKELEMKLHVDNGHVVFVTPKLTGDDDIGFRISVDGPAFGFRGCDIIPITMTP